MSDQVARWCKLDDFCHHHSWLVPRPVARWICDHFDYCILGTPKEGRTSQFTDYGINGNETSGIHSHFKITRVWFRR